MNETVENPTLPKLDWRKHIRMRPGMYIGRMDVVGLHYMLEQIIEDFIEAIMLEHGNHISLTLRDNNEIILSNNANGIPVHREHESRKSFVEHYLTVGFRNGRRKNGIYGLANGMHEKGISHISSLCSILKVEVKRDGFLWQQTYEQGLPTSDLLQIRPLEAQDATGTSLTLKPDCSIFKDCDFDWEQITSRARDIAYSLAGITVTANDERNISSHIEVFRYPEGMKDLVAALNKAKQPLHDIIYHKGVYYIGSEKRSEKISIEVAIQYCYVQENVIKTHVNTIQTDTGTPVEGLKSALVDIINRKASERIRKPFSWAEIRVGLTVAINVHLEERWWESLAGLNPINPLLYGVVTSTIFGVMDRADQRPHPRKLSETFEAIINKCKSNRRKS